MTDTTQVAPQKEQQQKAVEQLRDTIVLWYHYSDAELLTALEPHLELLMLRLNRQFHLHYFEYQKLNQPPSDAYPSERKRWDEYCKRYRDAITCLEERAVLFVPCISPTFLVQFLRDAKHNPRLSQLFKLPCNFEIVHLLARPTDTGTVGGPEPLSAHVGYEREVACQHISATIGARLSRSSHYRAQEQTPLTTLLLEAGTAQTPGSVASQPEKIRKWYHVFAGK